jgi:MFS family permease
MKPPCDEAVVWSGNAVVPCTAQTGRWILAAAILGSSIAFIDSTVVNVALPALQASLHATVVGVQWVVESYGLFLGALILVGGSLGDLFGRRLIFLIGVGLFAAASIACGLASNIQRLVVARSVQGIGAAFLVPAACRSSAHLSMRKRAAGRSVPGPASQRSQQPLVRSSADG